MTKEQLSLSIALGLLPLWLFLIMAFLAFCRVLIARFVPECGITRLLLLRVDAARYGQTGGREVGSGRGNLWAELTHEFRALYK